MVSKVTILELHFDGAQFGPTTIEPDVWSGTDSAGDDETVEESDDSKSPVVVLFQGMTVFVLLFAFLWVVLSRLLGADDTDE
jgi:hypothetical protein